MLYNWVYSSRKIELHLSVCVDLLGILKMIITVYNFITFLWNENEKASRPLQMINKKETVQGGYFRL